MCGLLQVFFQPEIFCADFNTPLATVVDESILSAPTDCRRQLYNNIVLSGGSTLFKVPKFCDFAHVKFWSKLVWCYLQAFGKRLERDIKKRVTARYNRNLEIFNITEEANMPKKLDVRH